ncbi:response regulator transcription factor [Novosphingobium ovatum]|uniref:response regulator transcription factor n=1 Tax=Novosphingobium ovatum TaxID=1908523 RepID=UPI0029FF170F|nr:response regulator transcription factor [Novosphingobium ovatum]
MHILIRVDAPALGAQIAAMLTAAGHRPTLADGIADALTQCARDTPDAVALETCAPDAAATLAPFCALPLRPRLLLLADQPSAAQRAAGLWAGADDYLALPCAMDELAARLHAICRRDRPADPPQGALAVGRLQLDAASHTASYHSASARLNRKEFSLLAYLMRNAGQLVTRGMILTAVWSYSFDPETNIVESNLSRLRGRLQTLGCDPIETQRGKGYVLRTERCG